MRGPSMKTEMPGFRRTVQPRHVHQRGMADMIAAAQRDQPLRDECAVEAGQRRDVGDRAERDMMQHIQEIRLRPLVNPEAALAQLAVQRDQRHQYETDGGEMPEPGEIVRPVRISPAPRPRAGRRHIGDGRLRRPTCPAVLRPPAAQCSWCRSPRSPATSRPCPRARRSHRRSDHSLRKCGPGYGSVGSRPQCRRCQARSAAEVAPSTS